MMFEEIFLKLGKKYISCPLTQEEIDVFQKYNHCGYRKKQCFANARALSLCSGGLLVYCEGIALSPTIPFYLHHAWVILDEKVIDVTWKGGKKSKKNRCGNVLGEFPEDWQYVGVEVSFDALLEHPHAPYFDFTNPVFKEMCKRVERKEDRNLQESK